MPSYRWIMVRSFTFLYCLYVFDMLSSFPGKRTAAASPITTASSNSDIHNDTEATQESRTVCLNVTLKPGASNALTSSDSNAKKGNVTTNAPSKRLVSKLPCVTATDGSSIRAEKDECFYGIGVFIAMMSMFVVSSIFQASIDLKHILSWNLFLFYASQAFFHLFFMFRDWNFRFPEDCKVMLRDLAIFSNFFLLTTLSWSSIMSSDLCMVKSYAIWDVKKINGAIRITNRVTFLQASALIAVLFSCVSMGIIYSMHILTYLHKYNSFCWVIQKETSPLIFTVTVTLMILLNCVCYCKRIPLSGIGENYPEFEYYVFYVRTNNEIFFWLSVCSYIMWVFNVLVYIFDHSWMWTLFLVLFDNQALGLLLFHQCYKTHNFQPLDEMLPPPPHDHPRPPRYRINTVGTQTKADA